MKRWLIVESYVKNRGIETWCLATWAIFIVLIIGLGCYTMGMVAERSFYGTIISGMTKELAHGCEPRKEEPSVFIKK